MAANWAVAFHPDFELEFDALDPQVQDEMLAQAGLLATFGPRLGRPRVDTLKGATHANMKELRFDAAGGVWRVAFRVRSRKAGHPSGGGRQGRDE